MRNHLLIVFGCTLLLSGCLTEQGSNGQNSASSMAYDVNKYPLNKVVCDGLDNGGESGSLYGGLKADLYYATGSDRWYSTADYISKGKKSDKYFFFSELNVPTRLFSTGFPLETGGMVKNDDGDDLIEFFALRFATILKLGADDAEGDYELALLSDDGSVLRVRDENGVYQAVVDNDGDHSTRLGCGDSVIHMTRSTELVVQLDYYQGPRTEISIIPLWRKINGTRQAEPLCGYASQRDWFDYLNNSEPSQNWKDITARGWRPLTRENFEQPNTVAFNPCFQGVKPEIDSLQVFADDGRIYATWNTNVPAASQLKIVNVDTGVETLTVSDNVLRRQHEVYQFNVLPGHYKVQAISISETYGKALSDEISVTAQ